MPSDPMDLMRKSLVKQVGCLAVLGAKYQYTSHFEWLTFLKDKVIEWPLPFLEHSSTANSMWSPFRSANQGEQLELQRIQPLYRVQPYDAIVHCAVDHFIVFVCDSSSCLLSSCGRILRQFYGTFFILQLSGMLHIMSWLAQLVPKTQGMYIKISYVGTSLIPRSALWKLSLFIWWSCFQANHGRRWLSIHLAPSFLARIW